MLLETNGIDGLMSFYTCKWLFFIHINTIYWSRLTRISLEKGRRAIIHIDSPDQYY